MYDNASELYNEYLEIYYDQYMALSDAKKKNLGNKYDPKNLFLQGYDYGVWLEESTDKEKLTDQDELTDIPPMPPQKGDEVEVPKRKMIKNIDSKQIINQTSNIISTNKSWKQFTQIKK